MGKNIRLLPQIYTLAYVTAAPTVIVIPPLKKERILSKLKP